MSPTPEKLSLRSRAAGWTALFVALAIVAVVWCTVYNRWSAYAWNTPVSYEGDSWGTLAGLKAFARGEVFPLLTKWPRSLGAPFVANWNDYPSSEEGLLVWLASLVKIFGLFAGANAGLLATHLLSAGSFVLVCRYLRYDLFFSVAAAVLFGLSRFSFVRAFSHITVNYYWHVPLGLLVIYWCLQPEPITRRSRRLWASIAIAVLHGIQNPYYAGLFGQFLLCTAFVLLLARADWRRIAGPLLIAATVVATFLVMNVDTLWFQLEHGPNRAAVARSYTDVEIYALKPIELLTPNSHRIPQFAAWALDSYFRRAYVLGEPGSAYLGFVGIAALAMLFWSSARAIALQDCGRLPRHLWCVLWILGFSVIGGLNAVLGTFGLVLFRSSNRYSIVLLAVLLLFLVRQASAWTRRWHVTARAAAAAGILGIGLYDQVPLQQPLQHIAALRNVIDADAQFTSALEAQLPPAAMVYQLPIMDYPESGGLGGLGDYELFRPYFFSEQLRFSYGSNKGRPRERWQREAAQLGIPRFVELLERYGFSSIVIARRGYADRGAGVQRELAAAGRSRILAESADMVAVELHADARPLLPPEFGRAFQALEGDATVNRRWSGGNARLILQNPTPEPRPVRVRFGLETEVPRHLRITAGRERLFDQSLDPAGPAPLIDLPLTLQPGRNELRFKTDVRGQRPPGGGRLHTFALVNFELTDQ